MKLAILTTVRVYAHKLLSWLERMFYEPGSSSLAVLIFLKKKIRKNMYYHKRDVCNKFFIVTIWVHFFLSRE